MVYFWYPTPKSVGARGQYLPGAAQMDAVPAIHEFMSQEFGKVWPSIVSGEISSHAIDGAPVARSRTPFPVVTFSHGDGSTGFQYTVLIEYLVSHGYVVVSIEHTYTAKAIWFPDGRVITQRNDSPPAGLSQAERLSWMMKQTSAGIDQGAAGVRFVIDRMRQLNHDKEEPALGGAIDLERLMRWDTQQERSLLPAHASRIRESTPVSISMVLWCPLPRFRFTAMIEKHSNRCCFSKRSILRTTWAVRPIRLQNTRRSGKNSFTNCAWVPTA